MATLCAYDKKKEGPVDIRDVKVFPMDLEDLDEIMEIERVSFPHPWSRELFLRELANNISYQFIDRAVIDGREMLVAYTILWIVADEGHILNIAVEPRLRRRGLARRFLDFILVFMEEKGVREVRLEVRRSNVGAIKLYSDYGFTEEYVRKNYYGDEDAILMVLDLAKDGSLIR